MSFYRTSLVSLALGLATVFTAQATENKMTQDYQEVFTCLLNGFQECASADDVQACVTDVFTTCLGDLGE